MTTLLIPPGHNRTLRAVVKTAPGMIALDMTCVSPAVRWFTLAELEAVNGRAAITQACKAPERVEHVIPDTDWPCGLYTPPVIVKMPTELMANIREAMYCQIQAA